MTMTTRHVLLPAELKLWKDFYKQSLTIDEKESIEQINGPKQLVFLPLLTYTLISTMLHRLKYLPNDCFNRIVIGETPVCGLRPLDAASPSLMYKVTELLRTIVDGVRKQHILGVTMIFNKKNNIDTIYDAYSLVFDYTIKSSENESTTSIHLIAQLIHQIEYMLSWNEGFPNDVELTFVLSTLDQFDNDESQVPPPFGFVKPAVKTIYTENETNNLMGRLTTPNGKVWLKFLANTRPLSGSSIASADLLTRANKKPTTMDADAKRQQSKYPMHESPSIVDPIVVTSPKPSSVQKSKVQKSKKGTKEPTTSIEGASLPSLSTRSKQKSSLLSTVKSFITPARPPAPVTSSTPNIPDPVLVRHTSTPKPGETASRITLGGSDGAAPLSAIYEVSTPIAAAARLPPKTSSPTPSTITATDISAAPTPTIVVDKRRASRAPTVRGQTTAARKKIATLEIEDKQDDDEEEFKKLFGTQKTKKPKSTAAVVPKSKAKTTDDLSDISSISATSSIFTPPTARKRPTTDRAGDDDLAAEHGTPPKTPRTTRRNQVESQSSIRSSPMNTTVISVNVDSPRLLRSITKKRQQQAALVASAKKQLAFEEETIASDQWKTQETIKGDETDTDSVGMRLGRSSMGLHYSMDESD